ncbi:hypothetical protein T265_00051 [Opisthorchis viverrini]|uniref:Uncharacterized protein n=1 Tax=Opisthorchis viverrini TaxID=6198 RepID=A0A075AJY3_OPIVI|nr:hypothetical protein T265_00051 [Opisthorchis viverrini]KER34184.1 hypothetical protein T265_00051 [Opisthorchis viverrini]
MFVRHFEADAGAVPRNSHSKENIERLRGFAEKSIVRQAAGLLNDFNQRRCKRSASFDALEIHPGGLWGVEVTYQQEMSEVVVGGELPKYLYEELAIFR